MNAPESMNSRFPIEKVLNCSLLVASTSSFSLLCSTLYACLIIRCVSYREPKCAMHGIDLAWRLSIDQVNIAAIVSSSAVFACVMAMVTNFAVVLVIFV